MIIGVDAGALAIRDQRLKMGVYWVNVNLLRELGKIDRNNTYRLYSFAPIDREVMREFGPNMRNVVVRPKICWAMVQLPLELLLRPVDVFLGLSQMIPLSPTRTIGFIYDLGFLHHPEAYPGSQKKLARITGNLVKRSDRIVAISNIVKDDIVSKYGVARGKITVVYPGVDKTFTSKGPAHKGKRPFFLFIGALKPGKNVPGLLRGFAEFLRGQNKPYDLYLGGGDYWKDPLIHEEIERLNLASRVQTLGFVKDTKLASFYRGAIAFVSPSLYEGFCLPAVEAMACGGPVIVSTAGALPEIVGDSGILVDPQNAKVLARAMTVMVFDERKRSSYIKKGLLQAKKYSWKSFAKKVFDLL